MNQAPKSWLLPSALVGYVALSSVYDQVLYGDRARELAAAQLVFILLAPLLCGFGLTRASTAARSGHLATDLIAVRYAIIGLTTMMAASAATDGQPGLSAAQAFGRCLLVLGALRAVAQVTAPPSILKNHPAAASKDAYITAAILWSTISCVHLLRAGFPEEFPLDPVSLQLASLFSSLGSLLLIGAVVLRLQLLRGLQLGVGDRAWSALAITVAGTSVGATAGFIAFSSPDRLAGWVLGVVTVGVVAAMATPEPAALTHVVRGTLASLMLATPVVLFLLWLSRNGADPHLLVLCGCGFGIAVGLLARRAARPLSPEGTRWLGALQQAREASLHPQPDQALRETLLCLRQAEPTSKHRPEIFRFDPAALLAVDIAGYLSEQDAEFPQNVAELAAHEPARTLRRETLLAAQVRNPRVRPLVAWFEAHEAKTATILTDEAGPVGLLILPQGKRKSALASEEATLLAQLAERLAGILGVTSSLKRARLRELDYQQIAENAQAQANELRERLNQKARSDHLEAEARVDVLRNTAHSPAAQVAMLELESHAQDPIILLLTKVGIDPVPWAAHAHLCRFSEPRPLVVLDFRSPAWQRFDPPDLGAEASPLRRAQSGTLVLLHPSALSELSQQLLAQALEDLPPTLLIACAPTFGGLSQRLIKRLKGSELSLPTLKERAEDLQALIINELSQLGLTHRGTPYGIERPALFELIEREFHGNDDELRGLLAALCGTCVGERVTRADLHAVLGSDASNTAASTPRPTIGTEERTRARQAPRSRR